MLGSMIVRRTRDFWYGLSCKMGIGWSEKCERCLTSFARRIAYDLYIGIILIAKKRERFA